MDSTSGTLLAYLQQDMHGPEEGNATVALQLRKQRDTSLNAS